MASSYILSIKTYCVSANARPRRDRRVNADFETPRFTYLIIARCQRAAHFYRVKRLALPLQLPSAICLTP
jgi:hypothetical protein